MRRRRRAATVLVGLALMAAPAAFGCGHCIEDRIAAVYDHGVIAKALDRRHQVAFFALDGSLAAGGASRLAVARALASEAAVDLPSLRVSVDAASLSLAYDAKRISQAQLAGVLNRGLAASGLRVSLLKVMAEPAAGGS